MIGVRSGLPLRFMLFIHYSHLKTLFKAWFHELLGSWYSRSHNRGSSLNCYQFYAMSHWVQTISTYFWWSQFSTPIFHLQVLLPVSSSQLYTTFLLSQKGDSLKTCSDSPPTINMDCTTRVLRCGLGYENISPTTDPNNSCIPFLMLGEYWHLLLLMWFMEGCQVPAQRCCCVFKGSKEDTDTVLLSCSSIGSFAQPFPLLSVVRRLLVLAHSHQMLDGGMGWETQEPFL